MTEKKPAKNKADAKEEGEKETCFTIMPFGGWFNDYYLSIYKPAIEAGGLDARRGDDLFRPSTIINDIWDYTKNARLVLADLTGKNPNVFYELGLAHALAKPAIIVAETMEDVPFDLRALRVIVYDKNAPDWGEVLKKNITKSIKEILKSPLKAVLPTFLDVKDAGEKPSLTEYEKEILELKQDIDALRRELLVRTKSHRRTNLGLDYYDESQVISTDDLIRNNIRAGWSYEEIVNWGIKKGISRDRIMKVINDETMELAPHEIKPL